MAEENHIEHDSFGVVSIPQWAYWGVQTQRATEIFKISPLRFPSVFIKSIGFIKLACAMVNRDAGLLDAGLAGAIITASQEVIAGKFEDQFPIDIFQAGSATPANMNVNEVIATRANELHTGSKHLKSPVHPNDHVNMGQSTNDVIPSALHIAACLEVSGKLIPHLKSLYNSINKKVETSGHILKTGRTHLMDALPITLKQELSGWAVQMHYSIERLESTLVRLSEIALGGTAVGTGVNTLEDFGEKVSVVLTELTGHNFRAVNNHFEAQSSRDAAVELSGQMKVLASALIKISNDLRMMNSGPNAGLSEITLPPLMQGSSIMPGKINPVVPEAVRMACVQVMGNDVVIGMSNAMGEFQLNAMLPVITYNLLQSITLLANSSLLLAGKAITGFDANEEHMLELARKNPILVTVLNPIIGYDKAAEVVNEARKNNKSVKDIIIERGYLTKEEADRVLDLRFMTGAMNTNEGEAPGSKL